MRTIKLLGIVAMLTLLGLTMTGCSETDPVGTEQVAVDDYETMDLDKANGGLTFTDEEPGFGDDYFAAADMEDADAETGDPLEDDAEVAMYEQQLLDEDPADPDRPRPVITVVRLTWGQLDGLVEDMDEDIDALDWSGSFIVDRGIVVPRRVILFERPRDHLLRPLNDEGRPVRNAVAWVSHTGPHFDGLILEIIERPVHPDSTQPPMNVAHLRMPEMGIELDIPVADLAGMDETRPVDENGNALRLEGFHLGDLDLCPKGFLAGIWVDEDIVLEDGTVVEGGFFKGRWMSLWGRPQGHLRGRYGVNEDGEQVFFGKYIGRDGRIRGLLNGEYEAMDENGVGHFLGRWINGAETVQGVLGGDYVQVEDRPGGFFSGRWAALCDEDAGTID